jgi:GntR family transcriptional regulator
VTDQATSGRLRSTIDRSSPVPYYAQVMQSLTQAIEAGLWAPGDQIPSEHELCELFGVSRTVVRQALKEMDYQGLLVREKGRGTFVEEPKISSRSLVHSLVGFYEDMERRGQPPVTEVLEQEMEPASQGVAESLEVNPLTPVIKLARLRFIQHEPIVLVTSYLPYELCPKLIHADMRHQSLYAFLKREYGLAITHGRRRIDAVLAGEREAKLLRVEPGAALLRLHSVSYTDDGRAVEYFHGFFRGDRSAFEVEINRRPGDHPSPIPMRDL